MGKAKIASKINVAAAVLFLLLLAAHLYFASQFEEWFKKYETFWPSFDAYVVRPPLGFCTGYTIMFGLFYLLRARIDIANMGRRRALRWIMSLATVLLVLIDLFLAGMTMTSLSLYGIFPFNINVMKLFLRLCNANWLWTALGVCWFVSLNANRVAELPEEDEEE